MKKILLMIFYLLFFHASFADAYPEREIYVLVLTGDMVNKEVEQTFSKRAALIGMDVQRSGLSINKKSSIGKNRAVFSRLKLRSFADSEEHHDELLQGVIKGSVFSTSISGSNVFFVIEAQRLFSEKIDHDNLESYHMLESDLEHQITEIQRNHMSEEKPLLFFSYLSD